MKKLLFSAALMMGFAAVSFAGTPKGETKEANEPNAAKSEAKAGTDMVWYKVTYDAAHLNGYIPAGSNSLAKDRSEAEQLELCDPGDERDCLRGFNVAPALPTPSAGDDQIKTNEQP